MKKIKHFTIQFLKNVTQTIMVKFIKFKIAVLKFKQIFSLKKQYDLLIGHHIDFITPAGLNVELTQGWPRGNG